MQARAVGLAAGFAADRLLGDPATGHPVAAFGRFAHDVEQRVWADDVVTGAAYTAVLVGSAGAVGAVIARATRRRPFLQAVTTAAATLGGARRPLPRPRGRGRPPPPGRRRPSRRPPPPDPPRRPRHRGARRGRDLPRRGRVGGREHVRRRRRPTARRCGRGRAGTVGLSRGQHPRRDGRTPQRAVRQVRAGVGAARRPAQPRPVTAVGVARRGPRAGQSAATRDAPWTRGAATRRTIRARTPARSRRRSPARSACRLGGVNTYRDRVEDRHTLGDGRPVEPDDITRSVRLAELVGAAASGLAIVIALRPSRRRPAGR